MTAINPNKSLSYLGNDKVGRCDGKPSQCDSALLTSALLLFPGLSKLHLGNIKSKTPQKNNRKKTPKTPEVAAGRSVQCWCLEPWPSSTVSLCPPAVQNLSSAQPLPALRAVPAELQAPVDLNQCRLFQSTPPRNASGLLLSQIIFHVLLCEAFGRTPWIHLKFLLVSSI